MHKNKKNILLISMPFAGLDIPSIQLGILESYLKERDVEIQTRHLYLKSADFYNIDNYNFLIYPPNDSYTAQMVFSKYVFPWHWNKNEEKFKNYYNEKINSKKDSERCFTFDRYIKRTDDFYSWIFENLDWKNYDIIGFTLNYGQFLPSLAVAKKIKELDPEKKIILGGSRTVDELGIKVLETFDYIDFVVSGDGEEALYKLAIEYENYEQIPGLIFRKGNKVIFNQPDTSLDLNTLPIPSYDSFYGELSTTSPEVQQFYCYNSKLPVEISRGCWWNKCTFCNLNIQHKKYREKNVDKIISEIQFLSEKYKMLSFQIIGNTLLIKDYRALCEEIIHLGKDFTFFAETRADQLKSEDFLLLKEAGFNIIQTGIESFSQNYLNKMNKGTRVIDNIAALKYCKENNIINNYNLLIDYPNEEQIDFDENKKTIKIFKKYLDPPQICELRVVFGSPIQCNPQQYDINGLDYANIDKIMFPHEILEKEISFVYSYNSKKSKDNSMWYDLVNNWKIEREMVEIEGIKSQNLVDKLVFYFVDGGNFIRIYDKRNLKNVQIFTLDELEREIFLSCIDIISFQELKETFSSISEEELLKILIGFEENGIIFREESYYLSLALRYSTVYKGITKERSEQYILIKQIS